MLYRCVAWLWDNRFLSASISLSYCCCWDKDPVSADCFYCVDVVDVSFWVHFERCDEPSFIFNTFIHICIALIHTVLIFSLQCLLLWHCWLGDRKGIWPVKKLDVGGDDLSGALHDLIAPVVQLSPPPPSSFAYQADVPYPNCNATQALPHMFFSIDGAENSRIARYINDAPKRHANCLPKAVMLEGKPRLLFFASKDIDIDPYTELRYDYGGKNLPWRKVSYHTYYIPWTCLPQAQLRSSNFVSDH